MPSQRKMPAGFLHLFPFGNTVTELLASTGAVVGTYSVGGVNLQGVAFDGSNIWVVGTGSNTVSKLPAF